MTKTPHRKRELDSDLMMDFAGGIASTLYEICGTGFDAVLFVRGPDSVVRVVGTLPPPLVEQLAREWLQHRDAERTPTSDAIN